jgi:DNA primase
MSNWVDFAALKRSIPLALVFERYQVKLRRSVRDQYRGLCPLHRGDGRDAFHANLSRNVFHCFSCGAGGSVLDFVAAIEACTLRQTWPLPAPPTASNWLRKKEARLRR